MIALCWIFGHRLWISEYSLPRCLRCRRVWANGQWHRTRP